MLSCESLVYETSYIMIADSLMQLYVLEALIANSMCREASRYWFHYQHK